MSKLIDLGTVSEETKASLFNPNDNDGTKVNCGVDLFYRKTDSNTGTNTPVTNDCIWSS